MPVRYFFAFLSLVALAAASLRVAEKANEPRNGKLVWGPCNDAEINEAESPVMCAELKVPLDYLDMSSTEKLTLQLMKYPAVKEPLLGSILMNFGGPGTPGRRLLSKKGKALMHTTGGQHDLITWDPRASLGTLTFDCFKGSRARKARDTPLHVRDNRVPDPEVLEAAWVQRGKLASACEANAAREGGLIGTAYSARDMLHIVDSLETGEGGLLRYWGFSAGSILGATFVAMFPDRSERVVIDGVANAHAMTRALGNPEAISSADDLVANIITACTKLPDGCPLAKSKDEPVTMIQSRLIAAFAQVWTSGLQVGGPEGRKLSWISAKITFLRSLYHPALYSRLITALVGLLHKDAAPMLELEQIHEKMRPVRAKIHTFEGIYCGDQKPRSKELFSEESIDIINGFRVSSLWFGQVMSYSLWMVCAQWKIDAKERYEGDFKVDTALKGPGMLIIGNSFDPATPWASAQNMSATLINSVLVKHNGHGHTSSAQRSDCTESIIRAYFTQGLLPETNTVCEPNEDLLEYLTHKAVNKAKREEDSLFLI